MPRSKSLRNWNAPLNPSWKQVSSQLRDLQDRISHYQGRFRAAGHDDIAEDLEKCIHLLMNAADVALTLDIKGSD